MTPAAATAATAVDIPQYASRFAPDLDPGKVLWSELMPGGSHWSYLIRRGTTLRFIDMEGGANVSLLLYRADERAERLNLPDTLKAQHTAHLSAGHALYSDMGRILASITTDSAGWHDPLCGASDAATLLRKYGPQRYQEHRNAMARSGRDGLLIELGKWGLGLRDLVPCINLFSKVAVDGDGRFQFAADYARAGAQVELRFEMDTLVVLSAAPHPFDPAPAYAPKKVGLLAWRSPPPAADDRCRMACPENQRGFYNTELTYC